MYFAKRIILVTALEVKEKSRTVAAKVTRQVVMVCGTREC